MLGLFILICPYISPEKIWYASLITQLIPIFLFLSIVIVVIQFFIKKRYIIFPLFILILGFGHLKKTFKLNNEHNSGVLGNCHVLSFNTSFLRVPEIPLNNGSIYSTETFTRSNILIDWIVQNKSEIKCLQEFYHNEDKEVFNLISKLDNHQMNFHYFGGEVYSKGEKAGLAIFSKYPIINKGEIFFSNGYNGAIFSDVKIRNDTIRIINVHLQSMSLKKSNPFNSKSNLNLFQKINYFYKKFKKGSIIKSKQIELLSEFIKKSPYSAIVCGDFNDTPYSYTLLKMDEVLKSTFEKVGKGFGFTYNGNMIPFLRIDHQFYGFKIRPINFHTHYNCDISDHFPIECSYMVD